MNYSVITLSGSTLTANEISRLRRNHSGATVLIVDPFGQYSGDTTGTAMSLREHLWDIHPVLAPPELRPMPSGRTRKCYQRPEGLPPLPRLERLPQRSPQILLSRKVEIPRARSSPR